MTKKFVPTEIRIPQVWAGVASRKKGVTVFMTYPPGSCHASDNLEYCPMQLILGKGALRGKRRLDRVQAKPSCTAVGNEAM
jgi:hypothetical protein